MTDSDSPGGTGAQAVRFPGTEEIRMVRSIMRLALGEAWRHGSYAASFRGFRVLARRSGPPRGSPAFAEVCLSVRLGEALLAHFRVPAHQAQGMEPNP